MRFGALTRPQGIGGRGLSLPPTPALDSLGEARRRKSINRREREAKIRRLVDSNIIGSFFFSLEGRIIEANDTFLKMVGYSREDLATGLMSWTDLTPSE